jgi:protocatechuate 3,4-dioxygenase beta subunit
MKHYLVAVVLVVALCVGWFAANTSEGEAAGADRALDTDNAAAERLEPAPPIEAAKSDAGLQGAERASVEVALDAPAPAEAAAQEKGLICSVFGIVADEAGAPLAGVAVRLSAYLRWSAELEGPALQPDARMRGWELATDEGGRFRFDTPVPDIGAIQALTITPDPYHDSHVVRFGRDGRPALQEGELDLGTLHLASTGAIAGHVRDASGLALENARARLADARWSSFGREATSDSSGRYVIGHIKPGSFGVNCEHEGHLSELRIPFEIVAGRTTEGVDFALRTAPTLKGRVIDVGGVALGGFRVWGWPQSNGGGAGATTDAEGRFTIALPQDEPYRLEVKLDSNDAFGIGDPDKHYAPNTHDIELVLARSVLVTVAVVDGASGAPVQSFGLRVERGVDPNAPGMKSPDVASAPQAIARPGGELNVRVRPEIDEYWIVAPGFQEALGKFEPELIETGRLEVRLRRGESLSGRALLDGAPCANVSATLEVGTFVKPRSGGEAAFTPSSDRAPMSLRTGADGRFQFEGVSFGRAQRLSLRVASGESFMLAPVPSTKGVRALDLGDLELQPSAAIAGAVLVPANRSRAGLVVRLDGFRSGVQQTTDTEGAFRFDGVAPGRHQLFVDSVPGRTTSGGPFAVELAPGAVESVELDLRDKGTCQVALTVHFPDGPATGFQVELEPEAQDSRVHRLGGLDEAGRISSWAPAVGRARIAVRSPSGACFRHPTAVLDLTLDARIDERIEFETASLALVFPEAFTLPSNVSVTLNWSALGTLRAFAQDIDPRALASDEGSFDGRRLFLARVPTGEFELTVQVFDREAPAVQQQTSPNSWTPPSVLVFEHSAKLTLAAGRTSELVLR